MGDLYATSLLHRFTTARQRETCARQLSHAGGSAARQRETARDSRETARDSARQPRDSRESYVNLCNKLVAYRSGIGHVGPRAVHSDTWDGGSAVDVALLTSYHV